MASDLIDAHHHFFAHSRIAYDWISDRTSVLRRDYGPAEYIDLLKRHGIQRSVIVQAVETDDETDFMLESAEANAFIGAVVGWIDLASPDVGDCLQARKRNPRFRGVRNFVSMRQNPEWVADRRLDRGFDALERAGVTFDALLRMKNARSFLTRLERNPGLRTVICHALKPNAAGWRVGDAEFRLWRDHLAAFASLGCHIKLSGFLTEAPHDWTAETVKPYVETILDIFGPARTMWGSDWPMVECDGGFERWLAACQKLTDGLTAADRQDVFGGAAERFYDIAGNS